MTIKEQAAYLNGMLSTMNLDDKKNENKLLKSLVEAISIISSSIGNIQEDIEDIQDDIEDIEERLDNDLDDLDDEFDNLDDDEDDNDYNDDFCYEVVCPKCKEKICLSDDAIEDEEIDCPNCGKKLEFDMNDVEDECCCDCCHDDSKCGCESCECEKTDAE